MEKSSDQRVIKIKGRAPQYSYYYSLPEVFYSLEDKLFSIKECVSNLNALGVDISEDGLIHALFSYRSSGSKPEADTLPFSFAGPFQMSSVIHSLFQFNLKYQDAVIKIELEKSEEINNIVRTDKERNDVLCQILTIVSTSLRTAFFSEKPVYLELTNMELDVLVLKCLLLLGLGKQEHQESSVLIKTGFEANRMARLVQQKILSTNPITLENLLPFLVFSGVVWWSDAEIIKKYKLSPKKVILQLHDQLIGLAQNQFAINDFPFFQEEVLNSGTGKNVLYFLDDNGELVWGLLFIRLLLDANPNLMITCVVNDIPVTNNANTSTVLHYLKTQGSFLDLLGHSRFCLFSEPNELPAIDLRFITAQLRTCIERADIILVNGVSFFEKLQYLNAPAYYLFTVYSETSRILTGFERYSAIFARIGPRLGCFSPIQEQDNQAKPAMTLQSIHAAIQKEPLTAHRADQTVS
jgi:hypothetical protein